MRIVMALGGNALLRRDEAPEAEVQRRNVQRAVEKSVAPIACRHELVVTHGNGPQVGLLALQAAAYRDVRPYPLDVLGAESEGMIGYLLDLALGNALPERDIATLLTQVEVAPDDPAFSAPSKPIGPTYTDAEVERLTTHRHWTMMRDGAGWRRAVPSPAPRRIREISTIKLLLRAGVIVVCAGGGGIPVIVTPEGGLQGIEAVIDKDLAAALLAEAVDADFLLLLTDVPAVWNRWPMSEGTPIRRATPAELRSHSFAAGSMGPKVEAACRFVERTGRRAGIGAIDQAEAILEETAGTLVRLA
ncbi:MAG TPA: carbamate kinase [Stellaceae bacterium]|nr:carbamate kinase [Stellaceae bacterium]